ncbi:MAG: HAMP domain-containing protein [Candidatus Contendobacter sp.]|nr:HAMP domain-containing protein [Candidatus Contendobacter sp.]
MREARVVALDREFLAQTERELSKSWPADHWPNHERNLGRAFGASDLQQSLLLVQDNAGVIYRSRHWPQSLNPNTLPWPQPENRRLPEPAGNAGNRADANRPPDDGGRPDRDFPPSSPPPPQQRHPAIITLSLDIEGRHWRFGLATTPDEKLGIGIDLAVVDAGMTDLRHAFLLATPLALGFIGLSAWFLSGRALSPIRRLTAAMASVTAKALDQRIALGQEDQEFRQLIQVFNGMLARLERSFLQASRFSADAAHELKTPLAILQGQIERAIAQSEASSPAQVCLTGILDEIQRLSTIARKLLLLSLADAGRLRLHLTGLDLSQVLEELLEDAQMLAPALDVSGAITPGLRVNADAELLRQVLHNLLSNATKYNSPNGWIRIAAVRQGGFIEVSIANSSPGILATDRDRIFERFYRADSARNRQIDGVGLGLSLSREIARAHGGDLRLVEAGEGAARFLVWLPARLQICNP